MAIAFDAGSWSSAGDLASGANHSHAGGASARAACVMIADTGASTDRITGVTYAGAAMNRVRQAADTTEAGTGTIYWLDAVSTGTQNVVVTHTGTIRIAVFTMTVTTGAFVALVTSATGTSASVSNPSWTMSDPGFDTFCGEVIHSGLTTMTNTPASGWSLVVPGALGTGSAIDRGAQGAGFARGPFTPGDITCGWTAATADDYVGVSVAFAEMFPPSVPLVVPPRRAHK